VNEVSANNPISLTLTPNYKTLLLAIPLMPLLIWLGFWQLDRAEQKQQLLQSYQQRLAESSIRLHGDEILPNYSQVEVVGQFDNRYQWLLDNRVLKGRVGYEVISPFRLDNGAIVLINRGWVQAPRLRSDLPVITKIQGRVTLLASVYRPSVNPLVNQSSNQIQWPHIINTVSFDEMALQSSLTLAATYLRIDELSSAALTTDWRVINTQPEKHTAYAVQWFAMALALCVLTLISNSNVSVYMKARSDQ